MHAYISCIHLYHYWKMIVQHYWDSLTEFHTHILQQMKTGREAQCKSNHLRVGTVWWEPRADKDLSENRWLQANLSLISISCSFGSNFRKTETDWPLSLKRCLPASQVFKATQGKTCSVTPTRIWICGLREFYNLLLIHYHFMFV